MTILDQPILIKRLLPRNPARPPAYVIIWPVNVKLPTMAARAGAVASAMAWRAAASDCSRNTLAVSGQTTTEGAPSSAATARRVRSR